jgi:enolase
MPSLKSICRILAIFFGKLTSGIYEALELRDGGSDYLGKGVLKVSYNQPFFPFSFEGLF